MIYMNVHDDVPSFCVSQGLNMQTAQAKSPECHGSHTPFLFFSAPPILLLGSKKYLLLRLIFGTKSLTTKLFLWILFPEVDLFFTRNFVGPSPRTSTEQCPVLGRRIELLIFGCFFFFSVSTGNVNHIMPLCLLLRKDKLESHESPRCLPACVCEK